jgi:hypothetical protein
MAPSQFLPHNKFQFDRSAHLLESESPKRLRTPTSKIQHSRNTRECCFLKDANVGKFLLAEDSCGTSETWPCVVHPIRKQFFLTIAVRSTDTEFETSAAVLMSRLPASLTAIDLRIRFPLHNLCLMYVISYGGGPNYYLDFLSLPLMHPWLLRLNLPSMGVSGRGKVWWAGK